MHIMQRPHTGELLAHMVKLQDWFIHHDIASKKGPPR
jgi:hypothetical protein